MNSYTFQTKKNELEYRIGNGQALVETLRNLGGREAWLNHEIAEVNRLQSELAAMSKEYYGVYYGYSSFGVTIGQ